MLDATVGFDPADPATQRERGKDPAHLHGAASATARWATSASAILTPYFGTAPEDDEVAAIVRKAVERARRTSALGCRRSRPRASTRCCRARASSTPSSSSTCSTSWRSFRGPRPCESLDEILTSGLYHNAVDGVLRRANEVESRDTEAYRAALAKREARDAEPSPTCSPSATSPRSPTRRFAAKPAPVGEAQARFELPAQRHDRSAGDQHPGRLHSGWASGRPRTAGPRVQRADAAARRLRLRARDAPAASAGQHAGASIIESRGSEDLRI